MRLAVFAICFSCLVATPLFGEDKVFSGPQVGEALPPFVVRGVLREDAGKNLDFVTQAADKPILLVFVHDLSRPAIGLVRTLTTYTTERRADDIVTGIVWLSDDATEAESTVKRVHHALAPKSRVGVSLDGLDGPGPYGLNRNVALTILVGKQGKTTANFALVQPSLASDLPKLLQAVVDVAGGAVPKLEELPGMAQAMQRGGVPGPDANLRAMIRPVIQKEATPEEVDRAAKELEQYVAENDAARKEVARITKTIIDAGRLENYGTPAAQEYLKKWAKAYSQEAQAADEKEEGR